MNVYCFFCETGMCGTIAKEIEQLLGFGRCIAPQILQTKWVRGVMTEEKHDWLPGYIFLYTQEPVEPILVRTRVGGVHRCLGDLDTEYRLSGEDLRFAMMLLEQDGVIGKVKLVNVGDRVRISDPVWESLEGTVIKLDRNRRRCCISYRFDQAERTVWVGYELLENLG